ncbi:S9 family peptidase [Christiangramia flava]|uniref:Dipeptidyl peptidase IV in 4-hydroxyproline catabolic gene cluster n=1 Tax=Christiangramia flava JLT2011 TaxID=1229726 RepID=A0A1L7I134_9FLAO|nr:S9 family peptidase [Christiangramia flava]APU67317.1 Dipeptidyl peptidase IV in 4-hydroxyproline catabolic gene cluster [Christiangramia flava JLT2011]OSS39902.1 Dipeptidyl peptidase IV [Christiangramia flava JLT2011]
MMVNPKILKFLIIVSLSISYAGYCQGTLEDYQRAEAIDTLYRNKVFNNPSEFHWLNDKEFWYRNNAETGTQYILVNAESKTKKAFFDHSLMAGNLSAALQKNINEKEMDLSEFKIEENQLIFQNDSLKFKMDLQSKQVLVTDTIKRERRSREYWGRRNREDEGKPVLSPDGRYEAFIKNANVYIRQPDSEEEFQLSYDGNEGFFYSPNMLWSPDSKKLMAYKVRPGKEHKIYFVESSPEDQLQPKLQSRDYLKPGDEMDFRSPQLFKVSEKRHLPVATDLFLSQFGLYNFKWEEDNSAFTFEFNQRGHQVYRVIKVDAENGNAAAIIDESSPTFIDYSGKKFRHDVPGKTEIIWASERDGYNHLYLYNSQTGKVKNQITSGEWPVREVIAVDNENRKIYFTASGMDEDQDPYLLHYCSIDFDGRNFTRLTSENGNHQVSFSPDKTYYIDQFSRVDLAPEAVLKKTKSQKIVMELEKASIKALENTGWKMPEVFTTAGRDGETDIWGIIVRPTNFDPNKKYPVIEYIYAGPHSSFVPKSFHSNFWAMSSLAELGFIVVQIDGMGTSNRSKAFHDVCWQNLKDAGFPDRKIWIKEAAKKYPYMDAERVGIRGTSAGGQSAGGALVFNSDFYDVAVASCGCHDNRMDKIWWNEQWMGYPVGPQYAASSNVEHADQLQGNLMLIVGEVDDNVDPASTMQFADALIKAGKDFELVVLPGENHTSGGEFGERKRRDFFVKHLLHVDPPSWDQIYKD